MDVAILPASPLERNTLVSLREELEVSLKRDVDLVDLFIGSEGTLGIITEIELKLAPALGETIDLVAFFPSEDNAVDFVL